MKPLGTSLRALLDAPVVSVNVTNGAPYDKACDVAVKMVMELAAEQQASALGRDVPTPGNYGEVW